MTRRLAFLLLCACGAPPNVRLQVAPEHALPLSAGYSLHLHLDVYERDLSTGSFLGDPKKPLDVEPRPGSDATANMTLPPANYAAVVEYRALRESDVKTFVAATVRADFEIAVKQVKDVQFDATKVDKSM